MNFGEFMAQLTKRFQRNATEIDEWGPSYRRVVGHLPPARLEAIFNGVMDRWTRATPPKPGDFAVLGPSSEVVDAVASLGSLTAQDSRGRTKLTRAGYDEAKRMVRRWIDEALRATPHALSADEASRLAGWLRDRAWVDAQRSILGERMPALEITEADIARVRAGIVADRDHAGLRKFADSNGFGAAAERYAAGQKQAGAAG